MAILEIKKFNDPVLRKECAEVREINKEIRKLVVDIAQTMIKSRGIGLAASQVGVLKRIIIVQSDLKKRRFLGLINPKITKKSSKKNIIEEGCLSFPNIFLKIKRAEEVEVEGQDFNGRKIKIKASGLSAHVIQHEIDHLDGILFFNRLNFAQKIKFKLKNFSIKL